LTTPEELSGLLNEAVAGLKRLEKRRRFLVPESMQEAAREYRENTDTVVAWGNEDLVWERKARIRVTEAFENYGEWCATNNRRPLGLQRFKQHTVNDFPRLRLSSKDGYPVFVGAELKHPIVERVKTGKP
jgi:putative DNA primase/helicase